MNKRDQRCKENTTLANYLLFQVPANSLCVIRESGWITATAYIDSEDLFARCIHPQLRDRNVIEASAGELQARDPKSEKRCAIPCIYVDID